MDKQTSYQKISFTFENPFDRDRFVDFVRELLNRIEFEAFTYKGSYIPKLYQEYISMLERIGKYTDGRNKIDILVVNLKKGSSIERARTMQRNFIAWYLNGSRGDELKDAALVAFVSPDKDDWRFSLVKMDYRIEETNTGRTKVKEVSTPARRWSFLVGKNEKSHTAQSRLAPLLQNDFHNPTLEELEEAFNIEKVTDEFFEKYRDLFLRTKEALDNIVRESKAVRKDFEEKGVDTSDFSKKLLGQIVFLYFLQKKGWFGVDRDADWGTGPKDFLRQLFIGKYRSYPNFFNNILEPLFYEALARQRDDDFYSKFECKIPFLNGGLFDALNGYDWIHTDILLPNDLFSNQKKTPEGDVGDGIFDVFDRYNFTVREDQPLEREVAVDPEMLGKIFENLLEVKDRKSKGTYYTPREIVNYMCEQSLLNYLDRRMDGAVTREQILKLIKEGEEAAGREKVVDEAGEETRTYHHDPSFENVKKHAPELDQALREIKVCDPAIGSGAFPVGMMTLIVKTREVLSNYIRATKPTTYDLKRHCIQNCLYGVDIDPGAVEIAKLRLWLSLVVDEEDIKKIKPLPNLDYKIMQGNSLLEEYQGIRLFDEDVISEDKNSANERKVQLIERRRLLQIEVNTLTSENKFKGTKRLLIEQEFGEIKKKLESLSDKSNRVKESESLFGEHNRTRVMADELRRLYKDFMESYTKEGKEKLREKIGELEWALIEATLKEHDEASALHDIQKFKKAKVRPYFLWKLHFPEVFRDGGRFDVVIANPPWVRDEKIKDQKPGLSHSYETYTGGADLYVFFYERAVQLLRMGGAISFISSNKFFRATYGKKLRKFLAENTSIMNLIDFGDLPIFDAVTYPCVFLAKRSNGIKDDSKIQACTIKTQNDLKRFEEVIKAQAVSLPQSSLTDESWLIESSPIFKILSEIRNAGPTLEECVEGKIYRGITTGLNDAFVINDQTRRYLLKEDKNSADVIKPFLRGRDIKRYAIDDPHLYLLFVPWHFPLHEDTTIEGASLKAEKEFKRRYPAIYRHLLQFKDKLKSRNKDETGIRYEWYALQRCAASYWQEFEAPKLVLPDISPKTNFAVDHHKGYFIVNSAYMIITQDKYMLGVLNSSLTTYFYSKLSSTVRGGYLRFIDQYLRQIPIANTEPREKRVISFLVDMILLLKNPETKKVHKYSTNEQISDFFQEVIDGCVYELYFREHMKERQINIMDEMIEELNAFLTNKGGVEEKSILSIYDRLQERNNPVRNKLLLMATKSPDIILPIVQGTTL